jgi:hypothetical protein
MHIGAWGGQIYWHISICHIGLLQINQCSTSTCSLMLPWANTSVNAERCCCCNNAQGNWAVLHAARVSLSSKRRAAADTATCAARRLAGPEAPVGRDTVLPPSQLQRGAAAWRRCTLGLLVGNTLCLQAVLGTPVCPSVAFLPTFIAHSAARSHNASHCHGKRTVLPVLQCD